MPVAAIGYWISVGYVPAFESTADGFPLGAPVRGVHFYLLTWGVAAAIAGIVGLVQGRSAWRMLGLALLLVPVTQTLQGILNSIGPLFAGGPAQPAFSQYQLSGFYSRKFLVQVGYPAAGFLLFVDWRPDWRLRDIAARLRDVGLPVGRSEGHAALMGWLFFPLLLFGSILVSTVLSQQAPGLVNVSGDGPYANMTVYHSILLAASAAMGEEIVYRGLFMVGTFALLHGRMAERPAWLTAWGVQAVVFGFAHASFNNPLLVIQAAMFGLISGYAALRFGILCAVVLHFMIDFYAFGAEIGGVWMGVLGGLLVANVGIGLLMLGRTLLRRQATSPG